MVDSVLRLFAAADCKPDNFLGIIPPWSKYLEFDKDCSVVLDFGKNPQQFWLVGFGILDILLRIAGLVAVGFVIYGGFRFVMSQGESENIKNARSTIINALIGVAIAVLASTLVNFVASQFATSNITTNRNINQQVDVSSLPQVDPTSGSPVESILRIVFGLLGGIALIVIIISAIRLMTASGDPQAISKARDTLIYAAVGLAIAISAFTIVTFVVNRL